jgi:hypothetical protein
MAFKFNPFTGKLDIAGGGSGGGGTVTSITAGTGLTGGTITTSGTIAIDSTVVVKDANNNISANAFFNNLATITASGTQVVLTAASSPVSLVTGSGGQTIKLPDATTLTKGTIFSFNNNQSSGAILVNNNSNTLIVSIPSGGYVTVVLLDNATAVGSWDRHDQSPANVSWSTNTFDYPGSITSATWNGNTVAANRGGTGQSSAFVAGGIAYGSSTSALGVTPIGTIGQVLTSAGAGTPTWTTPATGTVTSVTGTSPIASSGGATPAISIADAAADGTTKGAAAFNASDFDAAAGVVSIDYTNGQAASASTKGFLTSANWTTFNNKQATITTGAVDNAVLRADGTGGATLQNSDINIDDATVTTQANVAITNQHSGQTNSALVLTPKGTGALIAGPKPDGTATGGNARGTNAVDLQTKRGVNTQVASGQEAFIGGGRNNISSGAVTVVCGGVGNTASGAFGSASPSAICGGEGNSTSGPLSFIGGGLNNSTNSSGNRAVVCGGDTNAANSYGAAVGGGVSNVSSGNVSFIGGGGLGISGGGVGGSGNTASANGASILGGSSGKADRYAMQAHAAGRFSADGDAQRARFVLRCATTTNTGVEMALDGATTYLSIPLDKAFFCNIKIVGIRDDGSAVATYERQYAVKNVTGTSSEIYAPITIGTDNAAGTTIALSANNADDTLRILVTGVASQNWRWVASIDAVEVKRN